MTDNGEGLPLTQEDLAAEAKEITLNGINIKLSPVNNNGSIKYELFFPGIQLNPEDENAPRDQVIILPEEPEMQEQILEQLPNLANDSQNANELWFKITDLITSLSKPY